MKKAFFLFLLLIAFSGVGRAADDDFDPKLLTRDRMIVILGSFKDFKEAKSHAQAVSRTSGVPFSLQGMIYDKKRGLILPDDDSDAIYAGSYILRRYNMTVLPGSKDKSEFISVERSDAYPNLRPGYYIVVGGLYDTPREANRALARFRLPAADAYTKKTRVYMGCMH